MKVTELYKTIQCEGNLMGVVSVLLRLYGCNLSCTWCDERKSIINENYIEVSIEDLIKHIDNLDCNKIIITGGEPLLDSNIIKLCDRLNSEGYHITIETNGTILRKIKCNLVSISPKLMHSIPLFLNMEQKNIYINKKINSQILRYYIENYEYQLKFVVRDEIDFNEIKNILELLPIIDKSNVFIMPLASSRRQLSFIQKKIINLCIINNFRYGNRLQLQVWGKNNEIKQVGKI